MSAAYALPESTARRAVHRRHWGWPVVAYQSVRCVTPVSSPNSPIPASLAAWRRQATRTTGP